MPVAQVLHRITRPNLMVYPTQIHTAQPEEWSTIGDLHGNPLKLLYFMIARGAVKMEKSDYREYAALYVKHNLAIVDAEKKVPNKTLPENPDIFNKMEAILNKITVVPGALIRELGDDFCDRGRDDAWMFALIDKFKTGGGIFESLTSNHGEFFIEKMEYALKASTTDGIVDDKIFIKTFTDENEMPPLPKNYYSVISLIGLQHSLNTGLITPTKLINYYNKYKETLKVLSYDYPEEFNGEPVIYSHGIISKHDIFQVVYDFQNYLTPEDREHYKRIYAKGVDQTTDADMLPLIDTINRILKEKAASNMISSLFYFENGECTHLSTNLLSNRDDPNDDDIANTHGHEKRTYGRRRTLDSSSGSPNYQYPDKVFVPGDLLYTVSYATPEAAKKAKQRNSSNNTAKDNRSRYEYGKIKIEGYQSSTKKMKFS